MPIKPQILAAISGAISAPIWPMRRPRARPGPGGGRGSAAPGPPLNLWALAGRQEAMQLRQLMQRRSLR